MTAVILGITLFEIASGNDENAIKPQQTYILVPVSRR